MIDRWSPVKNVGIVVNNAARETEGRSHDTTMWAKGGQRTPWPHRHADGSVRSDTVPIASPTQSVSDGAVSSQERRRRRRPTLRAVQCEFDNQLRDASRDKEQELDTNEIGILRDRRARLARDFAV